MLQVLKDAHEENLALRAKLLEYQWLEESLRQRTRELNERMKELDCLYTVSSSLLDHHMPFERVLAMLVKTIPRGWQYPNATGVRLVFRGREYTSPSFRDTRVTQGVSIRSDGQTCGRLEICLLPEAGQGHDVMFLEEERELLKTLAAWIGEAARTRAYARKGKKR